MSKPIRIGRHQQEIIRRMRAGATLYKEAWGKWYLAQGTERALRVGRESSFGLYVRGIIHSDGNEEHPTFQGGYRTKYTLTKVAEDVQLDEEAQP